MVIHRRTAHRRGNQTICWLDIFYEMMKHVSMKDKLGEHSGSGGKYKRFAHAAEKWMDEVLDQVRALAGCFHHYLHACSDSETAVVSAESRGT